MVTLEFIVSEKTEGQQTKKHTNKQTDKRRRKDYSRCATITNKQTNDDEKLIVAVRLLVQEHMARNKVLWDFNEESKPPSQICQTTAQVQKKC